MKGLFATVMILAFMGNSSFASSCFESCKRSFNKISLNSIDHGCHSENNSSGLDLPSNSAPCGMSYSMCSNPEAQSLALAETTEPELSYLIQSSTDNHTTFHLKTRSSHSYKFIFSHSPPPPKLRRHLRLQHLVI